MNRRAGGGESDDEVDRLKRGRKEGRKEGRNDGRKEWKDERKT